MARTDIHRPSKINPADYEFVSVQYVWVKDDIGEFEVNREQREYFNAHRARTGGKFAQIEHGGTCFCCGARARFVARYYHAKSNSYIDLGEQCSEKLENGHSDAFRSLRRAAADARLAKAGKRKAQAILAHHGIDVERAWSLYEMPVAEIAAREQGIVKSIISQAVKSGQLSDKQAQLVKKLLNYLDNKEEIDAERKAKREAEKRAAAPCPTGRVTVTGVILTVKAKETQFGVEVKTLVRDESGFTVWGNLPKGLRDLIAWERDVYGDVKVNLVAKEPKVQFVAAVTPSSNDTKFGFFQRPSKVKHLDKGEVAE